MKLKNIFIHFNFFIFLLLLGCNKNTTNELITFDVLKNYPSKNLYIEDIAKIKYLTLELHSDYLFTFYRSLSDNFIICQNNKDKSIIFFDRETGKPVNKVDRYGNGPEEYTGISACVYSEEKDELFILDYPNGIKIYSRKGIFKRKIPFRTNSYIGGPEDLYDYDDNNLLFYDGFQASNNYPTAFVMFSKEDGHITKEIAIPYEKKVNPMLSATSGEGVSLGAIADVRHTVRNNKDFLLTDYSADTVYRFTHEYTLIPVLARTPSIQVMNPKIFVHSWLETKDFLFFTTEKLEFDWKNLTGLPTKGYLMEKYSGKFFEANVQTKDYKGKELVLGPSILPKSIRNSSTGVIVLSVSELLTANEESKLSGKLQEVVNNLREDDDEIILMILDFK